MLQTGKPPVGSPLVEFGLKRVYLSLGIYRLSQFPQENTPALRAPNPAVYVGNNSHAKVTSRANEE